MVVVVVVIVLVVVVGVVVRLFRLLGHILRLWIKWAAVHLYYRVLRVILERGGGLFWTYIGLNWIFIGIFWKYGGLYFPFIRVILGYG